MSFKRNILASYATQIYVTLVGILILPLYFNYIGAEIYGRVGIFTILQAWFNHAGYGLAAGCKIGVDSVKILYINIDDWSINWCRKHCDKTIVTEH